LYETKSESKPKLEKQIVAITESIFLVKILRDLSNFKDQIKKE
jgi:hypothetical protein